MHPGGWARSAGAAKVALGGRRSGAQPAEICTDAGIFGPLERLKSATSEAAQAQKIDRTGPMHPGGWARSADVAKIAHGRASLGRQLRQNTSARSSVGDPARESNNSPTKQIRAW
jgi:hypothetical protein